MRYHDKNGTSLVAPGWDGIPMLGPGDSVNYFVKFANFCFLARIFPESQKLQIKIFTEFSFLGLAPDFESFRRFKASKKESENINFKER